MDQQELKNVLEMHRKWVLSNGNDGVRADLRCANLSCANLSSANLRCANLSSANLSSANLSSANLSSADLSYANLSSANLSSADLSYANLSSASLRSASLRSADLSYANLSSASLSSIKKDFFARLSLAKTEAVGLYDAIKRGKINGTAYEGECACFCGTIANLRKENYAELTCGLKPESNSPTERWFLAITPGQTPESNSVARVTAEWLEEFISENGFVIPKYKLVSSLDKPELFETPAVP